MPIPWLRHWRDRDPAVPIWYDAEYRLPLSAFGKRWAYEPRRADFVVWYLLDAGWVNDAQLRSPSRATYEEICRVHTADYLERLASPATLGDIFGVDAWDVRVDEVMRTVRLGAGGTLAAARESLERNGPTVNLFGGFHHAGPSWGRGLCALNDMAIAVAAVRQEGFGGQVVVLDLDAHPPDGTAACLAQDAAVWIGSLSGGASTVLAGVDETVLPLACDDATYLSSLDGLLSRMPRPGLAFVVAGGDVLAGDHLGGLSLSLAGARRRDLRVADALRGLPSVWLAGGGYHPQAWQVLAGSVIALTRRTARPIEANADPLRFHFQRVSRQLPGARAAANDLSEADVAADLGIGGSAAPLLLGRYSADAIELSLFRLNLLAFLERRGYRHFRVTVTCNPSGGERINVLGHAGGQEHRLIECVLERKPFAGAQALYVHWLALRDPMARFSERRPRLPGQDAPGLGLAREVSELLMLLAEGLDLPSVVFKPAYYHTAYVARDRFAFVDPVLQGRFEAINRDLGGHGLIDVSVAFSVGRVQLNGAPYSWVAGDMAWWRESGRRDEAAIRQAREGSRFTMAPASDGREPGASG
ncbi:MAG: histone deacetylase [Vicinamibacterales bacterium]